ncbi:MAG: low specificity L-threonine aldolase [Patescibacteria group bacterium]
MQYSFYNDYSEGAHPKVLQALARSNEGQETGYGLDRFTTEAVELIRAATKRPDADVHFVPTGTQANLIVLSSVLRSYESVIAVHTSHINVHEAGALEATGHKIITVPHINGKLTPEQVRETCALHNDEHMVQPRVVYISQTTELGTVYSKTELQQLSQTCRELNLFFYIDGARLGSALTARGSDCTLDELAGMVDAFYIGGTKNGALLGEAVVINHRELKKNFRHHLKQRGALLAKGYAISLQFHALFTDGLYEELAKHANRMAHKIADTIESLGYRFLTPPISNQLFPILPNTVIEALKPNYGFYIWSQGEQESPIRLVTSWATDEQAVDAFIETIKNVSTG